MTRIMREGKPLRIQWGWFHVECMKAAVVAETGSDTVLVSTGRYEVKEPHGFRDATDGEVFDLWPGDVLEMWYQHSSGMRAD